jgi:hypothetical protein
VEFAGGRDHGGIVRAQNRGGEKDPELALFSFPLDFASQALVPGHASGQGDGWGSSLKASPDSLVHQDVHHRFLKTGCNICPVFIQFLPG